MGLIQGVSAYTRDRINVTDNVTYSEVPGRVLDGFIFMINDSTSLGTAIGQYIWLILGSAIIIIFVIGLKRGLWLK